MNETLEQKDVITKLITPAFKNVLIYELIIKAWNNYITNKQNKTIKLNNEIPHILIK